VPLSTLYATLVLANDNEIEQVLNTYDLVTVAKIGVNWTSVLNLNCTREE
jgi:hypothetical protein